MSEENITETTEVEEASTEISNANKIVAEAESLATEAIVELADEILEPIAKVENALKQAGVAYNTITSLINGNLGDLDSICLGLVKSVLPLDKLKELPLAQLRSLATSLSPKIKILHGGIGSVIDNVRQGLNISMTDIINSDALKQQLSNLGVAGSVLSKIDLTKATSIDGLTNELANATGISNIGDKLSGLWNNADSLINNFSPNKITKQALSKITNSSQTNAMDILKRFYS